MSSPRFRVALLLAGTSLMIAALFGVGRLATVSAHDTRKTTAAENAVNKVEQGEQTFRFDTFGDQAFWGDTLKLHQAIEGASFGGVGPGLSPIAAISLGLKVDVDAL